MARCGDAGDDLGSRILAARLAREMMRLCFLMERSYTPYSKWFGSAFARLDCAPRLLPLLTSALRSDTWQEREYWLSQASQALAEQHNPLQISEPLETQVGQFYSRPYLVLSSDRFAEAIRAAIASAEVLALPPYTGSLTQFVDSTDVQESREDWERLKVMYQG